MKRALTKFFSYCFLLAIEAYVRIHKRDLCDWIREEMDSDSSKRIISDCLYLAMDHYVCTRKSNLHDLIWGGSGNDRPKQIITDCASRAIDAYVHDHRSDLCDMIGSTDILQSTEPAGDLSDADEELRKWCIKVSSCGSGQKPETVIADARKLYKFIRGRR